jgi:hypothetical protein
MPVLKPNEAMIEEAITKGKRIGLLVTFAGTIPSMIPEFPPGITVVPKLAEGALAALDAGDLATHDRLAAEAAKDLADCDAIALGQFSLARAKEMVEKGVVEVAPLAFMRGRTLSNAFVILDEAQNTTPVQMKMFLTRLGFGSTCVVTGDPTQIDLPRGMDSGLTHALKILNNTDGVSIVHFTDEDVVRHPLVSRIIQAYDRDED